MFHKVLVANRGTAAARIIRALREMGIRSVAVYSEADSRLPYVRMADESVLIGPAAPQESYLNMQTLLSAARSTGADAIHPGYGFLSENAEFARQVAEAGLTFIGPSPEWINTMGHKTRARTLMAEHGMPICASSELLSGSLVDQARQASAIGFPLLIKPAAGGGGIGMVAVHDEATLASGLEKAQGLAERSFGNGELYVERLFERPRHIEFQIMADNQGRAIHLFERDCSVQRRHQKVIEEARAPTMPGTDILAMCDTAARIMQQLKYNNIGTVETLYDPVAGFSFLEMNTRLQVEHGVTEEITGIDIVKSQIALAAGQPLNEVVPVVKAEGHALQVRIYAEDPWRFIPSPGRLDVFHLASGNGVRVETGYEAGNTVSPYYDPMIAKVIAHGPDRRTAIARLAEALSHSEVRGIKTNIPFLLAALGDEAFQAGQLHTQLAQELVLRHAPRKQKAA